MKKLLLGNAAVAQGAYEAGVHFVSSYPGTPSTEITECMATYPADEVFVEWAPNEKVAAEAVVGASIGGGRSMSCCKHVGLNVMADPLFTMSYTGVGGGAVFCVGDLDGCEQLPCGFTGIQDYEKLASFLEQKGFAETVIQNIYSNTMKKVVTLCTM